MIEAYESKSYLPIQKRGPTAKASRRRRRRRRIRKERRKGHRALAFVLCKPRCLIAKSSRGGSSSAGIPKYTSFAAVLLHFIAGISL